MNYFFVFQNKTYTQEHAGGYLWAPEGTFSFWKSIKDVCKGDIIFHSYKKNIVAVSIASSSCYSHDRPSEFKEDWDVNGWRVDCKYYTMLYPITTSDYKDIFLELQPDKYAPFNKLGRGNSGYLFNCTFAMAKFIIKELSIRNQSSLKEIIECMKK